MEILKNAGLVSYAGIGEL